VLADRCACGYCHSCNNKNDECTCEKTRIVKWQENSLDSEKIASSTKRMKTETDTPLKNHGKSNLMKTASNAEPKPEKSASRTARTMDDNPLEPTGYHETYLEYEEGRYDDDPNPFHGTE
jgi:hypothetical protein